MKSLIDNDVNIGGAQKITGRKTFTAYNPAFFIENNMVERNVTPSDGFIYGQGIKSIDKNGQYIATLIEHVVYNNSGNVLSYTHIGIPKFLSSSTGPEYASVSLVYNNTSGETYFEAPSSDVVGSVITTDAISKASNGYVKLGNGIIIQWGTEENVAQNGTITFSQAFSAAPSVTLTQIATTDTAYHVYLSAVSSTNFTVKRHGDAPDDFSWVAIGY